MREFIEAIITNPFFGLVTAVIGYVSGCLFTIYRDKRKEFNVAADRLAETIHRENTGIDAAEFDDFARFLGGRTLRKYNAALKGYNEAIQRKSESVDLMGPFTPQMKDASAATTRLRELASFAKRR